MALNTSKSCWNQARLYHGNPKASIYRIEGGSLVEAIAATDVAVNRVIRREEDIRESAVVLNEKEFIFFGIEIYLSDLIKYNNKYYEVYECDYNPNISKSIARARLREGLQIRT